MSERYYTLVGQFSLRSWLLFSCAAPAWIYLIAMFAQNTASVGPNGFTVAVVLAGITIALHRLLRNRRDGWAISALLAPIIAFGSLVFMAWCLR
jgi:hypothetical protein